MAKSKRMKKIDKEKEIKLLEEELKSKDALYKRNEENPKLQIQIGLVKRGFPGGNMYTTLLEKWKIAEEELKIKIEYGFEPITPIFKFQKNKRWQEIQMEVTKKQLKEVVENIKETEKLVLETIEDIKIQQRNIRERRKMILDELKALGVDISKK